MNGFSRSRLVRGARRRLDSFFRIRARRIGRRALYTYYRVTGAQFSREMLSVAHGVNRYKRLEMSPRDVYHLRRNVHMLEKGLVMQPRRQTFATGYICETVELFDSLQRGSKLGAAESQWARHVLAEFFDATKESQADEVVAARSHFYSLDLELGVEDRQKVPAKRPAVGELPTLEQIRNLAHSRRSVRWYLDRPIDRKFLDAAVEIALQSPTACNRQPFRFLFLEDERTRNLAAELPMGTAGFHHQLPGLAVVVGDLSAFEHERDRHLIFIDSCLGSMAFIFALEAQGIASCVINWPDVPERDAAMRELLRIPKYEQIVMLIGFGYEDESAMAPFSEKRDLSTAQATY